MQQKNQCSCTRTERFANKKNAAVYSAAGKKKLFYSAIEKYGFTVPLCKNGKT